MKNNIRFVILCALVVVSIIPIFAEENKEIEIYLDKQEKSSSRKQYRFGYMTTLGFMTDLPENESTTWTGPFFEYISDSGFGAQITFSTDEGFYIEIDGGSWSESSKHGYQIYLKYQTGGFLGMSLNLGGGLYDTQWERETLAYVGINILYNLPIQVRIGTFPGCNQRIVVDGIFRFR